MIYPLIHNQGSVELLLEKGLPCLRPNCGCTTWWEQ